MTKNRRYEHVSPKTPEERTYNVHLFSNVTNWDNIIPLGFTPTGKRAKNMWHCEPNYGRNHAKALEVDHVEYCNIPMGFDIETTTMPDTCNAYMYHWQFAIGDNIILGRTWDEFIAFTAVLIQRLGLGFHYLRNAATKRDEAYFFVARIWDANLGFEFQFFRHRFDIKSVFAKGVREPLTALCSNGLFFQDCLAITNSDLGSIPKLYNLKTPKLKGDLDYSVIRNSLTKLTDKELEYCINDVKILVELADWFKVNYLDNGLNIPYTKTGILRDSVVKNAKAYLRSKTIKTRKGTTRQIPDPRKVRHLCSLFPSSYDEYNKMQQLLFRGGYTHGNSYWAFELLKNVAGVDFTSSYPAVCLQKMFPMTGFVDYAVIPTVADIEAQHEAGYATKARFKFRNLRATTNHAIESVSKTVEYHECKSLAECRRNHGMIVDNGRVIFAREITVWLTDVDLKIYKLFYTWDGEPEITEAKLAKYGYLPSYLTDVIKFYYSKKAELKKLKLDGTTEYKIAKAMVNAAYGMMCEHLHIISPEYIDGEWRNDTAAYAPEDMRAELEAAYRKEVFGDDPAKTLCGEALPKKFLSIYWGIWVTSWARYNLLINLYKMGNDGVYCDTDSIYFLNLRKHIDDILEWNRNIYKENKRWVDEHNEKHGFSEPEYKRLLKKDPEVAAEYKSEHFGLLYESFKDLGEFDFLTPGKKGSNCPNMMLFKQGGAKRYVKMYREWVKEEGDTPAHWEVHKEQTIAGLPKKAFIEKCEKEHLNLFDAFEDGLIVENCKNAHQYNDDPCGEYVTDADNNTCWMHEESSIGIFPINFEMKIDPVFIDIIKAHTDSKRPVDYTTGERI